MIETARTIALIRLLSGGTPAAKVQAATVENLAAAMESGWIADNAVTSTAYAVTVPAGSLPWASMNTLGGKTVVWNQLVDDDTTEVTLTSSHVYYTLISDTASIQTGAGTAVSVTGGTDMVCDLTLMFGSGNEPSTAAEFMQMFPADYYAYNTGELKSAAVTQMVTTDSNASTIGTYAIPAAIQALPGYGLGFVNTSAYAPVVCTNYIDYANKKFVCNAYGVKFVDLDWATLSTPSSHVFRTTVRGFPFLPVDLVNNNRIANFLCPPYETGVSYEAISPAYDMNIAMSSHANDRISLIDNRFSTVEAFLAANADTVLVYQLAEPLEIDISAYLTDSDVLINVEAGGSVTFENSLGDDYRIPVPSTVTYAQNLIPDVPSSDGTYTLTATVNDGDVTYSWA